jgi:peptidoglycan/xylan/chitin deacetylase (PgdA/CDA1 family)
MITRSALSRSITKLRKSQGCLLTFHRAAPEQTWRALPNRDFYIELGLLDDLLGYLVRNEWRVVTLDDVVTNLEKGGDGSRFVNFSIDDCYRDTFELVVPIFRKHAVPVTLFVTTGMPDRTLDLEQLVGRAGLESIIASKERIKWRGDDIDVSAPSKKRRFFERLSRDWERRFRAEYEVFCDSNDVDPVSLADKHIITWGMLENLRDDPHVEIGSHTVSHPRLSSLNADEALQELTGSRQRLQARLGVACRHFAFPFGGPLECGTREFRLAQEAGFLSASTTRRGILTQGLDRFSLPRNTLNGAHGSIAYIEAKLLGLNAVAAKVLNYA